MRSVRLLRASIGVCLILLMLAVFLAANAAQAGKRGRPKKPKAARDAVDVLRFMPDDCGVLNWVDVAKLRADPTWQAFFQRGDASKTLATALTKEFGLQPPQIDRITWGARTPQEPTGDTGNDSGLVPYVAVLELSQPLTAQDIQVSFARSCPGGWREETVAGTPLYVRTSPKPKAFFLAGKKTLVFGAAELAREVLERKGPVRLSDRMVRARERMDPKQAFVLAVAMPEKIELPECLSFLPPNVLDGMETVLLHLDAAGGLRMRVSVLCVSDPIAFELKGMFGAGWHFVRSQIAQVDDLPAEAAQLFGSLRYGVNDRCFSVQCTVPASVFQDIDAGNVASSVVNISQSPSAMMPELVPIGGEDVTIPGAAIRFAAPAEPCQPVYPGRAEPPCLPCPTAQPPSSPWKAPPRPPSAVSGVTIRPTPPTETSGPVSRPVFDPYSVAPAAKYRPTSNGDRGDTADSQLSEARRKIEKLETLSADLERRLKLAEQDRGLLGQRVELYRKQLEDYRHQIDAFVRERAACPHHTPKTREKGILPKQRPPAKTKGRLSATTPDAIDSGRTAQVCFLDPDGARVWWEVDRAGASDSTLAPIPNWDDLPTGATYRIRLTYSPGREDLETHWTLDLPKPANRTRDYLAHYAIPVKFTEKDLDQAAKGNGVTKVIYVPDAEFQEPVLPGTETLVSSRLDGRVDPVVEADRRGTILAVLRFVELREVAAGDDQANAEPSDAGWTPGASDRSPGVRPPAHWPATPSTADSRYPNCTSDHPPVPGPSGRLQPPVSPVPSSAQPGIFSKEKLPELLEKWERFWFLDKPEHATPFRVHGGII